MFQEQIKEILRMPNQKVDPGMMNLGQIEQLLIGLSKVVDFNVDGDIVELGCNVGESSKYLRAGLNRFKSDKKLWVYDSFEGLPDKSQWEEGTPWKPGTLKTTEDVLIENFRSNKLISPDRIVKCWFKNIKEEDLPSKISFAFLDGDFYDSIFDSLEKIYDKVSDGGYIFFHDYERPDLPGVKKAIEDFFVKIDEDNTTYSVFDQLGLFIKGSNKIKPKKKLGFLHIPRTGGTHLERVLNVMGPDKFINFFGANENQRQNYVPIIETMKRGDNKHNTFLQNPNLKTCELFAGHFSHNIEDCFDEDVEFFTILRDPIQRVTSMAKQFLTSKVYSDILHKDTESTGDNKFWYNLEEYLNSKNDEGLLTHEVHGFSNYMTKVIAGCDISDPNITVDENTLKKAVGNLRKMKYFGFFETYNQTIEDVLSILDIDTEYHCGPLKASKVPPSTELLFTQLNKYDIELYKIAREIKSSREKNITFVTALLDINRDSIDSNLFKRDFQKYLADLNKLLNNLQNKNIVIYIEEKYFDFVKNIKKHNVILKSISQEQIKNTEYYSKIQKVRTDPAWSSQKDWLKNSPQAQLELYNPLIFQKIHFLEDVSLKNPFNSSKFFWVDAGISNAQANPQVFTHQKFEDYLSRDSKKFLFINYPYHNFDEIHGFSKKGLELFYKDPISSVSRATFFGGPQSYISFLSNKFREIAHKSLDLNFLGTEESIFTLLNYLYPKKVNPKEINGSGLVRNYFDNLLNPHPPVSNSGTLSQNSHISEARSNFLPKPYKNLRNQQNPKAFEIFIDFFDSHKDLDLIIEIGSGFGGFTSFLYEQSTKINSKFITYEIKPGMAANIKKINENIDVRNKDVLDVLTVNEIENLINKHGKTLILCDGGSISTEFNTFSKTLKKGDIIMAHDYAPSRAVFEADFKGKIWNWLEVADKDIEKSVLDFDLRDVFEKLKSVAWVAKQKFKEKLIDTPIKDFSSIKTHLYILTFNFPDQLLHTIKTLKEVPEWLEKPKLFLLDNSTNDEARSQNRKIAEDYNFNYICLNENKGICGGRQAAAEHFHDSDADFMLFFEDDMTINSSTDSGSFCRNGFRKFIPNLYDKIHKIMLKDKFDFLKLSFTEVYFDNDKQCSWYNVPQKIRSEFWPHYDKLPERGLDPNVPLTDFKNIRNIDGCSYIDGEVYYANWPTIVSKSGNEKMFINTKWAHPYEQTWMSHIYQQTKKGLMKPAVLLASPITHNRFKHYKPEERREN